MLKLDRPAERRVHQAPPRARLAGSSEPSAVRIKGGDVQILSKQFAFVGTRGFSFCVVLFEITTHEYALRAVRLCASLDAFPH